jgi:photosystem II stability/assembly factor-like uncharacterized protein
MSLRRTLLICLLLLVPAASLAAAVPGTWSVLGPQQGGSVLDLVFEPGHPQVLYTGGWGPLYKSVDGGASWSATGRGLPPYSTITSLAIDPSHPSTLYSSQETGLYKSLDGGATWRRTALQYPVSRIALNPRSPQTLYAATSQGLFRSPNGGARWKRLTRGLPLAFYFSPAVFVDPASPKRIFATIQDDHGRGGLYKSLDEGFSWQPIHSGEMNDQVVVALAIDRRPPATLFAGTPTGIYKSTDDGKTWTRSGDASLGLIQSLALHPSDKNVLYAGGDAGVLRSLDRGETWTRIDHGLPDGVSVSVVLLSPANPQSLYVGVKGFRNQTGVYRSSDGGSSFTLSSQGISGLAVSSVAVDAQNPDVLWVIANGLPYQSVDRGRSWTLIEPGPVPVGTPYLRSVAISPADSQTVYLHRFDGTLLRSRDGGETWVTAGNPGFTSTMLKLDPQDRDTLWLTGQAIAPSMPATVYVFGNLFAEPRFLRTNDGGATGSAVLDDLPTFPSTLAIDPLRPEILYTFSTPGDLYKSVDGGSTWTLVSNVFRKQTVTSLIAAASGALYAGVASDRVYESVDGGSSWSPLGDVFLAYNLVTLAEDPKDPCRVYAGTWGGIHDHGLLAFTQTGTAVCP